VASFFQKHNENIFLISAPASKKWLTKNNQAPCFVLIMGYLTKLNDSIIFILIQPFFGDQSRN
jgi:hypothetical protein